MWSLEYCCDAAVLLRNTKSMSVQVWLSYSTPHDVPFNSVAIVDGNALLQALVRLPDTYGELAMMVFRCLPKVEVIHFVTDCYHQGSIKDTERLHRGSSKPHIIGGAMTRVPRDFCCIYAQQWEQNTVSKILIGTVAKWPAMLCCTCMRLLVATAPVCLSGKGKKRPYMLIKVKVKVEHLL